MTAEIIQLSAQRDAFYVPSFQVFVFGQPVGVPSVKDIVEVKYDDAIERIDGFTLTVNNWDAQRRAPIYYGHYEPTATEEHPDLFEPGTELMLCMGYGGFNRLMVTGVITSVDVQFAETGHSKLVVSGLNVLERFRRQQYTWSWPDSPNDSIRDSDVALALAAAPDDTQHKPGLGIEVRIDEQAREREPFFANIFMNNQYPILFLMERARARGYQVLLREEDDEQGNPQRHLFFGPTELERDVTYVLEWGKTLTSFHPTYANARQLYAVKVCGWDRTAKQAIEVRKTLDDIPEADRPNRDHIEVARAANREEVITQPPARTQQEAERRAIEQLKRNHLGMVEATGATVGLPDLRAGKIVHIRGVGRHFEGIYTVTTTSHVLNEQGYRTTFTAKRANPEEPGAHFAADLVEGG